MLHVGAEVLDHDVGIPGEAVKHVATGVGLQIDGNRALVAMQVLAIESRNPSLQAVLLRANHLDDLRAVVREDAYAGRPGPRNGEIKDLNVGQGAVARCVRCHLRGAFHTRKLYQRKDAKFVKKVRA